MAAGRFERWVRGWRLAFNGPNFRAYMGGLAAIIGDRVEAFARQAVLESLPSQAQSSRSLGLIGSDLGIERGPTESDASYRTRLGYAIPLSRLYGTPLGMLLAIYYAEFPGAVLAMQNGTSWTVTGTPDLANIVGMTAMPAWVVTTAHPNANPPIPASADGRPAITAKTIPWWTLGDPMDAAGNQFASRFAVVFPSTAPDPALGTTANLLRLQRAIAKWKPAKASCAGIWRLSSGGYYGDGTTYGDGGTYGGASTIYPGA